jgi:hypothetical protein
LVKEIEPPTVNVHLPEAQHHRYDYSIWQPFSLDNRNTPNQQANGDVHAVDVLRSERAGGGRHVGRVSTSGDGKVEVLLPQLKLGKEA